MDKVDSRFKKIINYSFLVEIIDLIVGLILIFCTSFVIKTNCVVVGTLLIVHGLFAFIRYLYDGFASRVFAADLVSGVVGIILGLFITFNTFETLSLLGILFGIWMLAMGLYKLFFSFKLIKANDEIYPLVTMMGILVVIMGCLIIFNPFESFMIITKLMGIFIIVNSAFEIMTLLLFRKRSLALLDLFE